MSHALASPSFNSLYDRDLALWSQEQARLLEQRRFAELDLCNLIDEVKSLGRSDKREIRNRLEVLIAHLLKWRFQPGRRTPSWERTIREQRRALASILEDSPSLGRYPADVLSRVYPAGHAQAADESGIDFTLLPEVSPFTIEQVLDAGFLPSEPDLEQRPDVPRQGG